MKETQKIMSPTFSF